MLQLTYSMLQLTCSMLQLGLQRVGNFLVNFQNFSEHFPCFPCDEFCSNSLKKLAYNSGPFLWDTHKAVLGLVAYFG